MIRNVHRPSKTGLLTLRNLPPDVAQAIREEAEKKGLSLNKAVIGLLEKNIGLSGKKKIYHDLDELSGSWSVDEAKKFEKTLNTQRAIDTDLWQ